MKEKILNEFKALKSQCTRGNAEKCICFLFAIIVTCILPLIPEKIGFGIYSLKCTIFNAISVFTVVMLAIIKGIKGIKNHKFNYYEILIAIYMLLVMLSAIFSQYTIKECVWGLNGRGEGVVTIISYMATILIFCNEYKILKPMFKYIIIAGLVLCMYGILQATLPEQFKFLFLGRKIPGVASGTMNNQNMFSSYVCIFLPMVVVHFLNTKHYLSLIWSSVAFGALICAQTMGGYIVEFAAIIAIIIFSVIFTKKRKETVLKAALLIVSCVCVFIILNACQGNRYYRELFGVGKEITKIEKKDNSFGSGRLIIWKSTLKIIKDYPILGIGPDSIKQACTVNIIEEYGNNESNMFYMIIVDKAHSEYLQIAATTGIPSLIVYLAILGSVIIRLAIAIIKKSYAYVKGNLSEEENKKRVYVVMIFASILSYAIQAIINISVVQTIPVFYALLGIGARLTLDKQDINMVKEA